LKLPEFDTKLGVNGKSEITSCSTSGALVSWLEQLPLEVLNTIIYGKYAVWVDNTHNATKYIFQTASPTGVD